MMGFKLDTQTMQTLGLFSRVTGVAALNLYEFENSILFIIEEGKKQKALGKDAFKIKKLEQQFNRKIKIVEFSHECKKFIKNLIFPIKINDIVEVDEGVFQIIPMDLKSRGLLIGRQAKHLRFIEGIVKSYHKIKEIKVQ